MRLLTELLINVGVSFLVYTAGSFFGWRAAWKRRDQLDAEWGPQLRDAQLKLGWARGRCGWLSATHPDGEPDRPRVWS